MKKLLRYGIFCILTIIMAGLQIIVFATETSAEPTGEPTFTASIEPTIQPTPVRNEISSIGDFSLKAEYTDNRVFAENTAINVMELSINSISGQVLHSIRSQEGDMDIFSVFQLTLICNGREIPQETELNVKIEQNGVFSSYENLCVFKITDNATAQRMETNVANGFISFNAVELGTFVVTGVYLPSNSALPTNSIQISPTLQSNETAGIITPGTTSDSIGHTNDEEGVVTPGAFVFWLIISIIAGIWIGIGIGFILWGRYKTKKIYRGPNVIGE